MHRRDFIATAAAGLAAAALAQPSEPPPAPKRPYRKAVMYGMIAAGSNVMDRFKILRDSGFQGVEMDGPSPIPHEEVLAAMDATGIKVHGIVDSVHWSKTLTHPAPEVREQG